jgi:alkylation response protein AidB-like acyl-CoA dehydrogenase
VDFVAVVDQAIALLRQRGRLTYPTLQLQFQLDDTHLEALRDKLMKGQRLAADEQGAVLVWIGDATSPLPYMQAKVVCAETAVRVTQDLMTMFGGTAFAGRLPFERYFRDARAGLVMGLANDQAYERITALMFPEDPQR